MKANEIELTEEEKQLATERLEPEFEDISGLEVISQDDISRRNRKMLYDKLSGATVEQISLRNAVPPMQVKECIESALNDIKTAELHKGVRGQIVMRLIDNILEIDKWKAELLPVRKKEFQTVDAKGTVFDLTEDDGKDRELLPKYMGELRQLYSLLDKMVNLIPDDSDVDDSKKVNEAILSALVSVAKQNVTLEERIRREEAQTVTVEAIEVEDEN